MSNRSGLKSVSFSYSWADAEFANRPIFWGDTLQVNKNILCSLDFQRCFRILFMLLLPVNKEMKRTGKKRLGKTR